MYKQIHDFCISGPSFIRDSICVHNIMFIVNHKTFCVTQFVHPYLFTLVNLFIV